jgi:hypothetical protein
MKKYSQSIFDSLIRIMPELKDNIRIGGDSIDPIAADALFKAWRTGSSSNQKTYKRPSTFSHDDLQRMQKEGLVNVIGDRFEVTEKGANVIKIMILGDDRSIFEENGLNIDYHTALNNTKNVKIAKKKKVASWWDRFEDKENESNKD